jgi:hypothetical protein
MDVADPGTVECSGSKLEDHLYPVGAGRIVDDPVRQLTIDLPGMPRTDDGEALDPGDRKGRSGP